MASYLAESSVIKELSEEALRELYELGQTTTKVKIKRLIKKMMGRAEDPFDPIFWPAGLLLLGLFQAGYTKEIDEYLQSWIDRGSEVMHTDDALTGFVCVLMYEQTGDEKYKAAAEKIKAFLMNARLDERGSIVYNSARANSYIYADGAGQTALFLARYGKTFGDKEAAKFGKKQIESFFDCGFDQNSGLMYHGYDAVTGVKHGIIGWGRAVGWFLMGMTETVKYIDPKEERKLMSSYRGLTRNVLRYLRQDGLYSWQLEAMAGPSDTSATGMILWSLAEGYKAGLVEKEWIGTAADCAHALQHEIEGGRVYGASAECIDFSQYVQKYGNFPWGQGAVLAFLAQDMTLADSQESASTEPHNTTMTEE